LRPATLEAQGLDALAAPLLDFLSLHQEQFGGILLKRILLIRRVDSMDPLHPDTKRDTR
jgi:hypothetical protein